MTRPCGKSADLHAMLDANRIVCRYCVAARDRAILVNRALLAAQATDEPAEPLDYDLIAKYDAPPVHNYADEAYERAVYGC